MPPTPPPAWITEVEEHALTVQQHPEARADTWPVRCPQCNHAAHGLTCVTTRTDLATNVTTPCGCPGVPR